MVQGTRKNNWNSSFIIMVSDNQYLWNKLKLHVAYKLLTCHEFIPVDVNVLNQHQ